MSVPLTFFDESLLNERVEVGIEPTMMDFLFVLVLEFVFDRKSVGVIKSGKYVQQIALKASEIVHVHVAIFRNRVLKYY